MKAEDVHLYELDNTYAAVAEAIKAIENDSDNYSCSLEQWFYSPYQLEFIKKKASRKIGELHRRLRELDQRAIIGVRDRRGYVPSIPVT